MVDQATREDLDDTLEYWIEEGDPEIASNAVICVDACTQYSCPSSRPGSAAVSPRPIIGLRISGAIEAIITGAAPVYAPGTASIYVGALSSSALSGQRPQGCPLSAPVAPGATAAHALCFRRRAPLRASHQRHQVLLVTS